MAGGGVVGLEHPREPTDVPVTRRRPGLTWGHSAEVRRESNGFNIVDNANFGGVRFDQQYRGVEAQAGGIYKVKYRLLPSRYAIAAATCTSLLADADAARVDLPAT